MRRIGAKASGPLLLLALAMAAGFGGNRPAGATHSNSPPWWWVDLKPWGDHHISYLLCGLPYYLPPEWEWGVENWDNQMGGYMEFDLVGDCFRSGGAGTWLVWELQDECPFMATACFVPITWQWHSTGWGQYIRTNIYFDNYEYENLGFFNQSWEDAFQTFVSAHEWGHNLNLADHYRDACADPPLVHLLMGSMDIQRPPCLTGPTTAELDSVIWDYGLVDSDGDGFTGAVEWYVGTDQADACPDNSADAAWPLDINNDRVISSGGDLINYRGRIGAGPGSPGWWQRLDLNVDERITAAGELIKYRGKIATTCS